MTSKLQAMLVAALAVIALTLVSPELASAAGRFPASIPAGQPVKPVTRTEADWLKALTPEPYRILRRKGTDLPHTGKYVHVKGAGVFRCAGCGLELFRTEQKFESGTGWPSFWAPYAISHVLEIEDHTLGMERVELTCARCGGHLGHIFDDGPKPTGLRYCINSTSLKFVPR